MKFRQLNIILIIVIFFGIALRYVSYGYYSPEHGAVIQMAMAKGYENTGDFVLQFGPVFEKDNIEPSLSNHFPPLYPLIIAYILDMRFPSFESLENLSFAIAIISIITVFFLTYGLFGLTRGLFCAALWSIGGLFIDNSAKCLSENIQVVLVLLFIFFFMSALKRPWHMTLSGLFLGLAYLSKSTLPFWISILCVAICSLFLILNEKRLFLPVVFGYLIFLSIIMPWGIRNYLNFHTFETSSYISSVSIMAIHNGEKLIRGLALNIFPIMAVPVVIMLIFLSEFKKIRLENRDDIILIFFSFGSLFISWMYSSAFYARENFFLPYNTIRYSIVSIIPLLWIVMKNLDLNHGSIRKLILCASLFSISGIITLIWAGQTYDKPLINEADIAMSKYIHESGTGSKFDMSKQIDKNDFYYYAFELNMDNICYRELGSDKPFYLIDGRDEIPPEFTTFYAVDTGGKPCESKSKNVKRIILKRK